MPWIIFRIILYILLFGAIWFGGQFYVAQEFFDGMHETSPYAIFVDQSVSGDEVKMEQQNGSITYPFSNIETALSTARENNINTILISSGTYTEVLTLPKNITLFGTTANVTILNKTPKSFALTTDDNINIINITISGGNNTVIIPHNTSATFINTIITNAHDFGVLMGKKERPKTMPGEKSKVVYEVFNKTDIEILQMPLVRFSNVTVTKNDNQGMYLRDGRVEIINSQVIENGEEGIDLHPHMHVTILSTNASNNGEGGLETEIYDNKVLIKNSTFTHNVKSGVALLTSMGVGSIILNENIMSNNQKFGMRCAVHKNRPSQPRPFFQSVIINKDNLMENNAEASISKPCFNF